MIYVILISIVRKRLKSWWALGDDFRTLPLAQMVANFPNFNEFALR